MSPLDRVLAEIRAGVGPVSATMLARRVGIDLDELDAIVGYWIHRGELAVDEVLPAADCGSCPMVASRRVGRGCSGSCDPPARRGPLTLAVRPTR
jgi:hypothetical protein